MSVDDFALSAGSADIDVADHLGSDDEIAEFLNIFLEEEDASMFVHALGTVARARRKAGIVPSCAGDHEALYQALCEEDDPLLNSVMRVMTSLGLRLAVGNVSTVSDSLSSGGAPSDL